MKKVLSVLLGFAIIFAILPAGTFTVSANEDIAYSDFISVEDNYYKYVERPKAAIQSDYSGGVTALSNAITAVAASVDISAYGILRSQMTAIFSDLHTNPAFFYWGGWSYSYSSTTNIVKDVTFSYYYTSADISQMRANYETAITKALSWIKSGMSNADKSLAMHDYLVLNAKYDKENGLTNTIPHISHTAYGILVLGVGVCDGYAFAYKDLLTRLGISTIKLSSDTMNHAWNMVYLGGKWYHVDVTWDDPTFNPANGWLNNDYDLEGRVEHEYFLLSDSAITNLDHSGWAPSTYIADSTLYDGDYVNIKSGMFWYQGYWYYNTGGSLTRSLFDLSNSSFIKTINSNSYLGVFNNKIYYNYTSGSKTSIRKINFDGTADTAVLTIDNTGSSVTEKITEFVIRNDRLRCTVYRLLADSSVEYVVRNYLPPPDIYGITDNALYNANVTISFSSGTALLDGINFSNGSTVSAEGSHTIRVTGTNGSVAIMYFTIDKTAPTMPTLFATPTTPTNGSVSVTVSYPADAATKEYKIGTGSWKSYTGKVTLALNDVVYARAKDTAGNTSATGSITVSNIDKTAPTVPTLVADPTTPTNGNVTVTITFPADATLKEYRIGSGAWSTYSAPVKLAANNTVYARATDVAGNISTIGSLTVSNIDKTAPSTPTFSTNPAIPTNGDVTVTITYPIDAATKEYKVGSGAWASYVLAVVVTSNDIVYARCTDAVGNVSVTASIFVSNIDKTAPAVPTLVADLTTPTNGDVTITISYPSDAVMKEYKIGTGAWLFYTLPLILTANDTVYARCTDAAGNTGNIGSVVVSNIDTTSPTEPTLYADSTIPTNGDVTITINYPVDAAMKMYRIGTGAWNIYTEPVVLTVNNTVYARAVDAAGNSSNLSSIVVSNIDKVAPATPTLTANPTTPVNGDVTVTISYPSDADVKEFKIGSGDWNTYNEVIVLTSNDTVYARCTDAVGNTSNTGLIVIRNIYKTPPADPTLVADSTIPTSGDVTVTIFYPADISMKIYRIGDGAWAIYSVPIVLTVNSIVYAIAIDAAGNSSNSSSIVVDNIDKTAPETPSLVPDLETPTNENVTISIFYPADAAKKEYKIGTGMWISYTSEVVLTSNDSVFARCTDAAGNISDTGLIVVSNIDKTAPVTPDLEASSTSLTNDDVSVTISYPDDATEKEFRISEGEWTAYTGVVVLTSNDTVYARCKDAAGNISGTASIVINNIDKVVPATPDLESSSTTPTNDDVSVTISYPDDATMKEFRIGTGEWEIYAGVVTLNLNDIVYARCTDEAGNTSSTGSIIVSNIDKTAPAAPTLVADTTAPTNGNVTITITYPIDGVTKEFRIGNGNWTAYAGDIVLNSNETVFARCLDAVGNISTTAFLTVGNIGKLVVRDDSTAIINQTNSFIYGLETGLNGNDFEKYFVQISGNARIEYEFVAGYFGTGTKVKLVDKITQEVLITYTIVIFGDVNGDGNVDAIDAGVFVDYENSINSWDALADAARYKASDVNGDGNIDSIDAGILVDVENNKRTIDQVTGLAS